MLFKIAKPGSISSVIAENICLRQQLIILSSNKKRCPNLSNADRFIFGFFSQYINYKRLARSAVESELKPMPTVLSQVMRRRCYTYEDVLDAQRREATRPKDPISVKNDTRNKNINTLLKISTDKSIQSTISHPSSGLIPISKKSWEWDDRCREEFNSFYYSSNRTSKNQVHGILNAIEHLKKLQNIDINASLAWDSDYNENGYSVHLKKGDVDQALVDHIVTHKYFVTYGQ